MLHDRDGLADGAFDVAQQAALFSGTEGDGRALGAGTRGAADAVDIGFRHMRQIVVDHVADAIDVDAARRDVGCHQHQDLARLEAGQRLLAVGLRSCCREWRRR